MKRYKGIKLLVRDALKHAFIRREERIAKMATDYKKVQKEQRETWDKITGRVRN